MDWSPRAEQTTCGRPHLVTHASMLSCAQRSSPSGVGICFLTCLDQGPCQSAQGTRTSMEQQSGAPAPAPPGVAACERRALSKMLSKAGLLMLELPFCARHGLRHACLPAWAEVSPQALRCCRPRARPSFTSCGRARRHIHLHCCCLKRCCSVELYRCLVSTCLLCRRRARSRALAASARVATSALVHACDLCFPTSMPQQHGKGFLLHARSQLARSWI